MDYARKIGKEKDNKRWLQKPVTMVTLSDGNICSNVEPKVEDRRLENWKKWLAERRKVSRRIKSITGREQTDQLINSCEKVRSVIEMKTLMEHASIPVPVIPDKYRGGPEFWNIPESLPNHGDTRLPEITAVPTKRELNLPPDLTYVAIPLLIEQEKDLRGISSRETAWERSSYLRQREKELHEEIELLMPKKPETRELIIRGKTFEEPKKEPRIPVITIWAPEEEESPDHPDLTMILKIQDREIVCKNNLPLSDQENQEPIEWSLKFQGIVDQRTEEKIILENKGNTVIHYHWRNSNFRSNSLSFQRHVSPFYFNKTDGMILQGQIVELKIWYLPRSINVFTESWRLFTDPKICHSPLIFRFWGCADQVADESSSFPITLEIDRYLDRCIRDSVIREIVQTIMANVDHKKPPEPAYGSLFLESEIFRTKNPYHFYHPNLILELRKLYREVVDKSAPSWSLSLYDLREILLLIKTPERRQQMLLRFTDLWKECSKPTLNSTFVYDQKHAAVYNLLCSFANSLEIESEFVMASCIIKEDKESSSAADTSWHPSVKSLKQRKESKKGSDDSLSTRAAESFAGGFFQEDSDDQPYREMLFVRLYDILCETIERIGATIDSLNRLAGTDKLL
ncbi:hypothetical protein KPH14_006396 [Odynerus spinipes]|uniref:MYCBP-associated protein n=1 Tax=Odynerus spinipes TaxID=1348599 RepID=A0AAD9RZT0_9HYME|nr:hypothetical protein KPH14_006396 [Odynerus spinipes]